MDTLLLEYLPILIFIGLAMVLGGALLVIPLVIAPSKPDPEKLSAYECGFPAFGDARMKFDVRFYLVDPLHHFRPGSGLPVSLGDHSGQDRPFRLLVDDGVPGRADRGLYL